MRHIIRTVCARRCSPPPRRRAAMSPDRARRRCFWSSIRCRARRGGSADTPSPVPLLSDVQYRRDDCRRRARRRARARRSSTTSVRRQCGSLPKDVTNPTAPTTNNDGDDQPLSRVVPPRRRPQLRRRGRAVSASTAPSPSRSPAERTTTVGFELVRHVAKQESPLVQLSDEPEHHHDHRRRDVLRQGPGRQRHQRHRHHSDRLRQFPRVARPMTKRFILMSIAAVSLRRRRRARRTTTMRQD